MVKSYYTGVKNHTRQQWNYLPFKLLPQRQHITSKESLFYNLNLFIKFLMKNFKANQLLTFNKA